MKIAMIGHKRIPSREGGVEIVVEQLALAMTERGHEVTVYNRKGKHVAGIEDGKAAEQSAMPGDDQGTTRRSRSKKYYQGIRIISVPTPSHRSLNALIYSFFATVHAIFSKYDVIHYHAEGPCAMIWLARLFGKRCVATIHGLDWQRSKWGGFATRYLRFGEKVAARYAQEVIVLSENVRQYFMDTYQRETVYLPNGISIPERLEADLITREYGLTRDGYLLFLARIVPEKGLHYLLEAYSNIDTDLPLVVAGGSSHTQEYYQQMQEMAAKDPRVILTGFVQGQKLAELFSNCLLYILPSDVEGMPLSLLEAMSYGKLPILSNIPENKEVAGDKALYFERSNVQDLQGVLMGALSLHKQGLLAKQYPEEALREETRRKYSWEDIAEKTLELYK